MSKVRIIAFAFCGNTGLSEVTIRSATKNLANLGINTTENSTELNSIQRLFSSQVLGSTLLDHFYELVNTVLHLLGRVKTHLHPEWIFLISRPTPCYPESTTECGKAQH